MPENDRAAFGRPRGLFLDPKPTARCGLVHYLWAHGYQIRHKRGFWMIAAGNSSEASRAEGAIYQKLSAKLEAKSE